MAAATALASWNEAPSRRTIVQFVDDVTRPNGPKFVPPEERIAVFDNDGTLWCEKPIPIELGFILKRLAAVAAADASLQSQQPFKAAHDKDYAWLGDVVTKHYHGDDSDVKVLMGGILQAFAGMTVDAYSSSARTYLQDGEHPTLKCKFASCGYQPMVELLRYLEAHAFTVFIASGGDRDFMRAITQQIYQVPPERVIGSSTALRYQDGPQGGDLVYVAKPDVFDDGPAKPVRIWSRLGRRPILAVGNSNGDIEMLQFAGGSPRPSLRLVILHDDGGREFDYVAGAERVLDMARQQRWTVVSMKNDWQSLFAS